jgi:hypothetical protein
MKKSFGDYRQLWKRHLWEGPEHLLYIDGTRFLLTFQESYKRIDYKNIQAITIVRTATYWVYAVLRGLGFIFFGWMAFIAYQDSDISMSFFLLMFGLTGVSLLIHLIQGPTCRFSIQTAVQLLHIKQVKRRKQALKIMERLQELCLQHQSQPQVTAEPAAAFITPPGTAAFTADTVI